MTLLDLLVERDRRPGPRIGDAAPLLALGWMTLGGALAHAGWLRPARVGGLGRGCWRCPVLAAVAVQHRAAAA